MTKKIKKRHRRPSDYSELVRKEGGNGSKLSHFLVCPPRVSFETQDSKEQVLLLLRRHFFTNVSWILIVVVMILVPAGFKTFPAFALMPDRFRIVTGIFWYLFTFGFALERFLSWYFNVYIVTDERVVDIDFHSLLYKEISSAKIDKIEDVTYKVGGALRGIFNFGTVYIQTAAESREFDFEDVPRPDEVMRFINEMILEEEREHYKGKVR